MESDKQNKVHNYNAFPEEVSSQNFEVTLHITNLHYNTWTKKLSTLYTSQKRKWSGLPTVTRHGSCVAGVGIQKFRTKSLDLSYILFLLNCIGGTEL